MTAEPNWNDAGPRDSDANLAKAFTAGDMQAFAAIYDRYADRLHDFCVGMLADRDAAADCVQDAFCIAATRIAQLRDPDSLRPWLYSIARNEALRRMRDRRRETPSDELPDVESGDPGPDALAARTELADLVAEAACGLSDRDRAVLELAFRHGLGGPDLAEALGVTPANANTIVHRLRDTIERSLGALLVSRRARKPGACTELAEILKDWDHQFTVLMRKRISRHIESCSTCDEERRRLVSPVALLGATPVFIPAPEWLRERTLHEVELTCASRSLPKGNRSHGYALPGGLFLAGLLAVGALAYFWLNQDETQVTPVEFSTTVSVPPPPPVSVPAAVPPPPPVPTLIPPTSSRAAPPPSTPQPSTPKSSAPQPSPPAPPSTVEPSPPDVPPPPVEPSAPPVPPQQWPAWPDWLPTPPAPDGRVIPPRIPIPQIAAQP